MAVRLSALRDDCPLPPVSFLVLISVRDWVDPRVKMRLEGLGQLKNSVISSGIESVTFRFIAWPLFYTFLIIQRVGRTSWAEHQPTARPLPSQDNTNTGTNADIHASIGIGVYDQNVWAREDFTPLIAQPLWSTLNFRIIINELIIKVNHCDLCCAWWRVSPSVSDLYQLNPVLPHIPTQSPAAQVGGREDLAGYNSHTTIRRPVV
jgi:hypothetical protein